MASHFSKKVHYKDWDFDSIKERDFFIKYIECSGKRFEVHKSFKLITKFPVGGYNQGGITYAPDFVIYDADGVIEHVYDVKSGINQAAVDTAAKLRFKLFALKAGIPVEVVVPRKYDFKMKLYGFTDPHIQTAYVKHDRHGNVKRDSKGRLLYDHYNVHKNIDYDIHDLIGR